MLMSGGGASPSPTRPSSSLSTPCPSPLASRRIRVRRKAGSSQSVDITSSTNIAASLADRSISSFQPSSLPRQAPIPRTTLPASDSPATETQQARPSPEENATKDSKDDLLPNIIPYEKQSSWHRKSEVRLSLLPSRMPSPLKDFLSTWDNLQHGADSRILAKYAVNEEQAPLLALKECLSAATAPDASEVDQLNARIKFQSIVENHQANVNETLLDVIKDRNADIERLHDHLRELDGQLYKKEKEVKTQARHTITQESYDELYQLKEDMSVHALYLECELRQKAAIFYDLELELQSTLRANDLLVEENARLKTTIASRPSAGGIDSSERDRLKSQIKKLEETIAKSTASHEKAQKSNTNKLAFLERQLALRDELIVAHVGESTRYRAEIAERNEKIEEHEAAMAASKKMLAALQGVINSRDRMINAYGNEHEVLKAKVAARDADIAAMKELEEKKDKAATLCAECRKPARNGHRSKPSYDVINIELPPSAYLQPPPASLSGMPATPRTSAAPPQPHKETSTKSTDSQLLHAGKANPSTQPSDENVTPPKATRGPLSPPKQPVIFGVGSPSASGGHLDPGITAALRSQISELETRKRDLEGKLANLGTTNSVILREYKTAIEEIEESLRMVRQMYGRAMNFNHEARVVKQKRKETRRKQSQTPRLRKQSTGSLRRLYYGSVRKLASPSAFKQSPQSTLSRKNARAVLRDVRDVFQQDEVKSPSRVSASSASEETKTETETPTAIEPNPPVSILPKSTSTLLRSRSFGRSISRAPVLDVFGEEGVPSTLPRPLRTRITGKAASPSTTPRATSPGPEDLPTVCITEPTPSSERSPAGPD